MHRASADTNLVDIHEEMSKLLEINKCMYKMRAKNEFWGSCKPTKKYATKIKKTNQIFSMKEVLCKGVRRLARDKC